MLRIGIRDYLVSVNPILLNDFIEIFDEDDSKISDTETARSFINQQVSCFKFTPDGQCYMKFLATLKDITPIRDKNFDRDSWEITLDNIVKFVPYSVTRD